MNLGWWIAIGAGALWLTSRYFREPVDLPPGNDDGTLVRLVESGHRVEAIRRYRGVHGGGLKEAKEAVEALARGIRPKEVLLAPGPEPSVEVEALVRAGQPLEAIKAYRDAHPEVDLLAAKQAVDALRSRLGG